MVEETALCLNAPFSCCVTFQSCSFKEDLMATHSSTLAWKIPLLEEPGRLQSMGSQRVRHDLATSFSFFFFSLLNLSSFISNKEVVIILFQGKHKTQMIVVSGKLCKPQALYKCRSKGWKRRIPSSGKAFLQKGQKPAHGKHDLFLAIQALFHWSNFGLCGPLFFLNSLVVFPALDY